MTTCLPGDTAHLGSSLPDLSSGFSVSKFFGLFAFWKKACMRGRHQINDGDDDDG